MNLSDTEVFIPEVSANEKHARWLFDLWVPQFKHESMRATFQGIMRENGVDTRPTFYPASLMPPYQNYKFDGQNAESTHHQGLFLPTFFGLEDKQIDEICDLFKRSLLKL